MTFDDFVGNEKVVTVLHRMLESDRVPHALLFSGQKGVGKFTLATLFARAANCQAKKSAVCGSCESCKSLAALEDLPRLKQEAQDARGSASPEIVPLLLRPHPNVTVIVPDGAFIRVSQMRAVVRQAYSPPVAGGRNLFLFDEAEKLRFDFADVLLKILEEPPEHTTLVLVTHSPYKLRPTLRSRCVPFYFAPLSRQQIEAYLSRHGKQGKTDRELAAAASAGSLGSALRFDTALYRTLRSGALTALQAASGAEVKGEELFSATATLAGKGGGGREEGRETLEFSLDILYSLLTDILYLKAGAPDLELRNPELRSELSQLSRRVNFRWVDQAVSQLDRIEGWLRRNVNRQLTLDAWSLGFPRSFSRAG